jgi:hypothetical protein
MASDDDYSAFEESSGTESDLMSVLSNDDWQARGTDYNVPVPPRPVTVTSESGRSTAWITLAGVRKKNKKNKKKRATPKFGEVDGEVMPETDMQAYRVLLERERLNFANLGAKTLAVYNDETGLWSIDDDALDALCARNAEVLGDFYGEQNQGVQRLVQKCKCYHQKLKEFGLEFDAKLEIGELPLHDGIYNYLTDKFRPYTSDKMCTVKMHLASYDACTDADREEIRRILKQMFPDDGLYAMALSRLALAMFAHRNFHREVLVFYGDGANGKTLLIKLLRMVFGDLVVMLGMNNLKETPDSAGDKPMAWPQTLQGARLAIVDEMNGNLDCALTKRLRGDDLVEYRVHHSPKLQTKQLTTTIALFGNDPPQCPKADSALSESLIAMHMPAKGVFGEPDPDPKKMQFKIDPDILEKFKGTGMQVAMVRELSEHLKAYMARGRKHPPAFDANGNRTTPYDFTGYLTELENKGLEDLFNEVVTTQGATPRNTIKNKELYEAIRSNGYNLSLTKFLRDIKSIISSRPEIGVVSHARQSVYTCLKWVDTPSTFGVGQFGS